MFQAPPSSKTVTCSTDCSSIHRSRAHLGKRNQWRDTGKAKAAASRTGNLKLGTPAARRSAKAGPYESNINAKRWIVVSPDAEQYEVRNLRLWCEQHAALFEPRSWRHAYAGLRQVAAWLKGKTPRQVSQWRGWTLRDLPTAAGDRVTPGVR
jgi:hypothetical protein